MQRIYDSHPPLIFYLHGVPRLLVQEIGMDIVVVLRALLVVLIFISIVVSERLIRALLQETRQASFMTYSLAFVLLFLPADAFGQREHVLLIFTIPYLFFAAYRLEFPEPLHWIWVVCIGMIGGIGFAIKPFFCRRGG